MKKKKEYSDPYPLVRVEWIDSCEPHPNSEIEKSEIPSPQRIVQVGLMVVDSVEYVSVAGAFKPDLGTFDYVITIPRFAVQSINRL